MDLELINKVIYCYKKLPNKYTLDLYQKVQMCINPIKTVEPSEVVKGVVIVVFEVYPLPNEDREWRVVSLTNI